MRITLLAGLGAVLAATAGPALAHHSGAMFDRAKTITLKGVVKEYQFTNPHSWIEVMVADETGKMTQWGVEAESPAPMRRLGLTPSTLKAGDQVTVRAHPLRDGRPGGSFVDIALPNGVVIGSRPPPAAGTAPAAPAAPAAR